MRVAGGAAPEGGAEKAEKTVRGSGGLQLAAAGVTRRTGAAQEGRGSQVRQGGSEERGEARYSGQTRPRGSTRALQPAAHSPRQGEEEPEGLSGHGASPSKAPIPQHRGRVARSPTHGAGGEGDGRAPGKHAGPPACSQARAADVGAPQGVTAEPAARPRAGLMRKQRREDPEEQLGGHGAKPCGSDAAIKSAIHSIMQQGHQLRDSKWQGRASKKEGFTPEGGTGKLEIISGSRKHSTTTSMSVDCQAAMSMNMDHASLRSLSMADLKLRAALTGATPIDLAACITKAMVIELYDKHIRGKNKTVGCTVKT